MSPDTTLKLVDLIKDGVLIRFFWTDEPQREIGIHSYDASGMSVGSEALDRDSARARWSQLIRAGFVRGGSQP